MSKAKVHNIKGKKDTKLKYSFKNDVLFKMLFVDYPHLLKRLVAVLLGIPVESIAKFEVINPEMTPEEIGKKFCRLDIVLNIDGKKVNLEVQVRNEGAFPERVMYHWARLYSSSLPAGENYAELPQTIIISIIDFPLFNWDDVHSEFQLLEIKHHKSLSDKQAYHFYELSKLDDIDQLDLTNEKDLWLALFNAETEDELNKLVSNGGEVMTQAVEAYRSVTATERFQSLEWLRRKTAHDEAQAIYHAKKLRDDHWQGVLSGKDAALADKDAALADKDVTIADQSAVIADKDAVIAKLQAQLKKRG